MKKRPPTLRQIREADRKMEQARAKAFELRQAYESAVTLPSMRKYIGRHFKYRNSYSCPQKDTDYWWLYIRIIGVEDGSFVALKAQTDQYGRHTVQTDSLPAVDGKPMEGWVEIDDAEFDSAVHPILDELTTKGLVVNDAVLRGEKKW